MKLQYIGTGAAEGFPGMFCRCEVCELAKKAGGRNLKTRSCCLLNDEILIDLSPDLYARALVMGLSLWNVKHLVVTHTHKDHLDSFFLSLRAKEGAIRQEDAQDKDFYLSVYGSSSVEEVIKKVLQEEPKLRNDKIKFVPIQAGIWFQAGSLSFCPLVANHKKDELCYIYVISDGTNNILYANDTGSLPKETLEKIKDMGLYFHIVSMDCARGTLPGDSHMGIRENLELKICLESMGCAGKDTGYYLNHLSHMSGITHDGLQNMMGKEGFTVTYDGMTLELHSALDSNYIIESS